MEFEVTVSGERYHLSPLNQESFLVTGPTSEFILYRHSTNWRCAEDIRETLLTELGAILDKRLQMAH